MENFRKYLGLIIENNATKIIVSNAVAKSEPYKKIVVEKKNVFFHISKYTEKQVFHDNIDEVHIVDFLSELIFGHYKQVNAWSEEKEHIILISQKGVCNYKTKKQNGFSKQTPTDNGQDRKKNYILPEGMIIQPLTDMGVFTADGKIVKSMYSKYKQINRFLEIIDDEISKCARKELNIIDFGCGKSYLTFILYFYLTEIKKISVNMIGLDLKSDVIEKCNKAAKQYGYTGLRFELGDINGYNAPFDVDMVVTLHACDTATDYALYNAIKWGAKYVFSVPCCQHELNEQMAPENLTILSRYGIIKERFSALATDAIRGNIMEYCGYKTQLLEFVDFDHTPKNILIRAVKRANTPESKRKAMHFEIKKLVEEFGYEPTLCKLFNVF